MPRRHLYIIFAFIIFILSVFLDGAILEYVTSLRTPFLNGIIAFKTDFGLIIFSAALLIYAISKKKYVAISLMVLAIALGAETAYLLKKLTQIPRPFEVLQITALTESIGYSFPSLHATFAFAIVPFLGKIIKKRWPVILSWIFLVLIALSRVYIGVHYLSDVIAGGIIGYTAAIFWLYLEEKHHVSKWFIKHVRDKKELRRQIAHLLTGIIIVFLLGYEIINAKFFIVLVLAGGILSVILKKYKIPYIYPALKFFERPHDLKLFPGKGAFFYFVGCLLSLLLFEKNIALAAIVIMAVGDAITSVIGTYFGKIKNPFNPVKHFEGTMLAIILSTLAAFFFVSFEKAFLASTGAMLIESFSVRYLDKTIDDNILIPLTAGVIMTAMV